jgi:hypothetical protein
MFIKLEVNGGVRRYGFIQHKWEETMNKLPTIKLHLATYSEEEN